MKRQESRAVIARRGAASAGLVSSADRAYMNAPVPRPTPNYGTKCPRRIATLTKKQTDFSLKIEMGGTVNGKMNGAAGFAISPTNGKLLFCFYLNCIIQEYQFS